MTYTTGAGFIHEASGLEEPQQNPPQAEAAAPIEDLFALMALAGEPHAFNDKGGDIKQPDEQGQYRVTPVQKALEKKVAATPAVIADRFKFGTGFGPDGR